MLRETEKNYTHVYLDLTDEIIYFHSTSAPCRLGKSLLDFIYMDLKTAFQQMETVREIHPYFFVQKFMIDVKKVILRLDLPF